MKAESNLKLTSIKPGDKLIDGFNFENGSANTLGQFIMLCDAASIDEWSRHIVDNNFSGWLNHVNCSLLASICD